jgi:nitrite reductase/ring-hydroxylating ferredoxin subunit/multimeric flavodoxin WrbA
MSNENWYDLGAVDELRATALREVVIEKTRLAIVSKDGELSVISGACHHMGGSLGKGTLDGDYVVCPWHYWSFHRKTGAGRDGTQGDRVPSYTTKIADDHLWVDLASATPREKAPRTPHPLARPTERAPGPMRVIGISTTAMTHGQPRTSTSEHLLGIALDEARALGCEARMLRLDDLSFRNCEGFYSKAARACTWPCSITQMDPEDQMDQVYEAFVHWADVILVSTPIRWGAASALYYKMVERCNCIQNQETIASRVLMQKKVAGFIVTGGQDNVQGVVGQMLTFFAEIGCQFPQHPFIAHSRGWTAEDMENNVRQVLESTDLSDGARGLSRRCVEMANLFLNGQHGGLDLVQGGRKAHRLTVIEGVNK